MIDIGRIYLLFASGSCITMAGQPANPPRLKYATYADLQPGVVYGFTSDAAGYAYVGGARWPTVAGPLRGCAFLTKLNQVGSAAVWSICLALPQVNAVAVDSGGFVYVAASNPWIQEPSLSTITKLSPDGQQTIYSTTIPGAYAAALALDRRGSAYVIGSPDPDFKPTPGAYLATPAGAFITKLDPSGNVQYATYMDIFGVGGGGLAVDSQGQAWAVGIANAPSAPPTGCGVSVSCGSASAVRKLDANGAKLLVSKTFGGGPTGDRIIGRYDAATGVAVNTDDSVWVVGTAESSGVPTTPGTIEPKFPATEAGNSHGGVAYAVKFSSSGDVLYGTYVGAGGGDRDPKTASVAVDAQSRPYFTISTNGSPTGPMPMVVGLSPDASSLAVSMDFNSYGQNVALDGQGGLYIAGNTSRLAFFTTPGAYQALFPGSSSSGYVAKFDLATAASASQFSVMVNAASLVAGDNPDAPEGAVAPGEIVTLFGQNLPSSPKVTFDGTAAPILYADANQINAVVPFEVSAPSTIVSLAGVRAYVLPVWPAVPALFTADGSGKGQLAGLNEDGTVNSAANPAKAGSVVSVYMTGVGAMMPPIGDGQLGPLMAPFPMPVFGMSALMNNSGTLANGIPAPILFAGQAPGLIAGAVQVNVQIPAGVPSGNVSLTIYVDGGYQTQIARTTIAVAP